MLFPVASASDDVPAAAPPIVRSTPSGKGGTETLLVVEDSDDVRALAVEQLSALGYKLIVAASGEQALELLGDNHVDLLFTDIVMPGGMSGLELIELFHARRPDVPILMTTGYNDDLVADIPRGSRLDVIGKPYRREELADRIRSAIDRPRAENAETYEGFGHKEG
jgi:CheY-like chemotaxis protein